MLNLVTGSPESGATFRINPLNGDVADQQRWQGEPMSLVGFTESSQGVKASLSWKEFARDPGKATGLHPIFMRGADGSFYTHADHVCSPAKEGHDG